MGSNPILTSRGTSQLIDIAKIKLNHRIVTPFLTPLPLHKRNNINAKVSQAYIAGKDVFAFSS